MRTAYSLSIGFVKSTGVDSEFRSVAELDKRVGALWYRVMPEPGAHEYQFAVRCALYVRFHVNHFHTSSLVVLWCIRDR